MSQNTVMFTSTSKKTSNTTSNLDTAVTCLWQTLGSTPRLHTAYCGCSLAWFTSVPSDNVRTVRALFRCLTAPAACGFGEERHTSPFETFPSLSHVIAFFLASELPRPTNFHCVGGRWKWLHRKWTNPADEFVTLIERIPLQEHTGCFKSYITFIRMKKWGSLHHLPTPQKRFVIQPILTIFLSCLLYSFTLSSFTYPFLHPSFLILLFLASLISYLRFILFRTCLLSSLFYHSWGLFLAAFLYPSPLFVVNFLHLLIPLNHNPPPVAHNSEQYRTLKRLLAQAAVIHVQTKPNDPYKIKLHQLWLVRPDVLYV